MHALMGRDILFFASLTTIAPVIRAIPVEGGWMGDHSVNRATGSVGETLGTDRVAEITEFPAPTDVDRKTVPLPELAGLS